MRVLFLEPAAREFEDAVAYYNVVAVMHLRRHPACWRDREGN
ncbi:MAG: hypothetical protein AAGU21_10750 [Solidesulfovibrio sp.]